MSTPTLPGSPLNVESDPFRYGWRFVKQTDEQGQTVLVQVPLKYEDLLHPEEEDFIVQDLLHDHDCFYLRSVLARVKKRIQGAEVFHDVRVDWEVPGLKALGPDLSLFLNVTDSWRVGFAGTLRVKQLGVTTALVIEVTSMNTRSNDLVDKVVKYHRAGVPIYALVDYRPELDDRKVHVLGYRWTEAGYVRLPLDEQGRLWLEPVKLWLAGEGDHAVFFDEQNRRIPEVEQLEENLQQAEARIEEQKGMTEEAIEDTAKERKARQEAEKARKEAEEKAADEAKARQEAEKARKAAEEKAADEAKAREEAEKARLELSRNQTDLLSRMAEMEAEMRRLRGETPPG